MVSKNNRKLLLERDRDEKQRFSIRKLSIGAASVLVGLTFSAYSGQTAHAATETAPTTVKTDTSSSSDTGEDTSTETKSTETTDKTVDQGQANVKQAKPVVLAAQTSPVSTTSTTSAPTTSTSSAPTTSTTSASTTATEETVSDKDQFMTAIKKDNITTIKIANDISLDGDSNSPKGIQVGSKKNHEITITSADSQKHKLDFNYNWLVDAFDVTFENLALYDNTVKGLVQGAQSVTFNNVDFHGDTLINTAENTTVNFKGTVNAQTANSYKFDDNHEYKHTDYILKGDTVTKGTEQTTDGDSLVSVGGTVNFEEGSNVTLSTVSGHVIQVHKSSKNPVGAVHVKQNSTVVLNPHTMDTVSAVTTQTGNKKIAYGIYDGGETDQGLGSSLLDVQGSLTINLKKGDGDQGISGGIYGFGNTTNTNGTGVKIANGGKLDLEFDGKGATLSGDLNLLNTLNNVSIGENSVFTVNAKDLGAYTGTLVKGDGFTIGNNSHVTITADGTGKIIGASGLTFTNPTEVNIDLSKNTDQSSRALAKGQLDMEYGRTKWNETMDSAIVKGTSMTFDAQGAPNVSSQEVFSDKANDESVNNEYNKVVYFVAESSANDTKIESDTIQAPDTKTEKLVGHVTASSGNENIFVNVTISGVTETIEGSKVQIHNYKVTDNNAVKPETVTTYAAKTNKNGDFTIDLSKYKTNIDGGATITITAQTMDGHKATSVTLTVANVKEDYIKQVKEEATKVAANIDKLASLEESERIKDHELVSKTDVNDATTEINKADSTLDKLPEIVKKHLVKIDQDGANAAIDNEAAAVKKDIPDLTTEETQDLSTAVTTAKNEIGQVTEQKDIPAKQNEGLLKIDKLGAKDAIEHAVTKAKAQIAKAPQDKQEDALTLVTSDQNTGEKAVETAKTLADVTSLKARYVKKIQEDSNIAATQDHSAEIAKAEKDIKTEADKIIGEIDQLSSLSPDKRSSHKTLIQSLVSNADSQIQDLSDSSDFATGLKLLEDQTILAIDQEGANASVDDAVDKIEKEDPNLSPEEKSSLESSADGVKKNIKAVTDKANIDSARSKGLVLIAQIGATAAIGHAISDAEKAAMTSDNSENIIKQLEADKTKFENQIKGATDVNAINTIQTQGLAQIQTDSQPTQPVDHSKEKEDAKKAIQAEADKVIDEIGKMLALSQDARTSYLNAVKNIASKVDAELGKLDTTTDFDKDLNAIKNSLILSIDKDEGKAQIDNEVATVEQENPDLSSEEKQALEDKAKDAKNSITTSTEKPDVSATILAIDKLGAKDAIAHAITNAELTINTSDASDREKKAATDKLQGEKEALEKSIDAATTQDAVKTAKTKALAQIQTDSKVDNSVSQAQKAAKEAIKAEAEQVKKDIDSLANIDNKDTAKTQVDQDEQKAEQAIDATKDATSVDTVKQQWITTLDQDGANYAIDDQVAQVEKDISNLTDSEQQAAKNQIQKDADAAKDNIKKATTKDAVSSAQKAGILLVVQDGANAEIDHEAAQVKTAIDGTQGLTQEQKEAAKQKVDTDAGKAKDDIKNASTPDKVKAAQIQGIASLEKDKTVDVKPDDSKSDDHSEQPTDPDHHNDSGNTADPGDDHNNDNSKNNDQPTTPTDDKNASDNTSANNGQSTNSQNGQTDSGVATDDQSPAVSSNSDNTKQMTANDNSSKGLATDQGNVKPVSSKGPKQVALGTKNTNAKSELPQAGAKKDENLGAIGLAIATAGSWLGLGINKKRREK